MRRPLPTSLRVLLGGALALLWAFPALFVVGFVAGPGEGRWYLVLAMMSIFCIYLSTYLVAVPILFYGRRPWWEAVAIGFINGALSGYFGPIVLGVSLFGSALPLTILASSGLLGALASTTCWVVAHRRVSPERGPSAAR